MGRPAIPPLLICLLAACSGAGDAPGNAPAPANGSGTAAPGNGAAPAPAPALDAAAWLPPPGAHAARVMAMAVPPEAEALAARITASIQANAEWYQAYARQHPQGELPWHENLGVSAEDYRRFQALARQISLREAGRITLNVTRRSDGGLALAAGGGAAALDGIILYPERGRAETPLGRLGNAAPAGNPRSDSPTGPWQGVRWTNQGSGAARRLALSFGRRAAGDMMIFYDYGPSDAETVILFYPAPAGETR